MYKPTLDAANVRCLSVRMTAAVQTMEERKAVLMNTYLQHVILWDALVMIATIQHSLKISKNSLLPGVVLVGLSIEPQCDDDKN
jgi:hypothetical protein